MGSAARALPDPAAAAPSPVVAVGGLVATGKSTLAKALAKRLGAPRIEGDAVRRELLHGCRNAGRELPAWTGLEESFEAEVYSELLARAAERLREGGGPVVVDACFPRSRQRAAARSLARCYGRPFLFVECAPDEATIRERLAKRDARDGEVSWTGIFDALAAHWQPCDELADGEVLRVDTARPLDECIARALARLDAAGRQRGA